VKLATSLGGTPASATLLFDGALDVAADPGVTRAGCGAEDEHACAASARTTQ
jgi:hypothetical protein